MGETVVRSEAGPGIAGVTLNRPERLNAMDNDLVADLRRVLEEIDRGHCTAVEKPSAEADRPGTT